MKKTENFSQGIQNSETKSKTAQIQKKPHKIPKTNNKNENI